MTKLITVILLSAFMIVSASATSPYGPEAPSSARRYLPDETENFGEGLWFVIRTSLEAMQPGMVEACKICVRILLVALVAGMITALTEEYRKTIDLISVAAVSVLLYNPSNALVQLARQTIIEISQYGNLLLPVMSGALIAQGAPAQSAAVYTATAFTDMLLTTAVSDILLPLLYIFLSVSVAHSVMDEQILDNIRSFTKWITTWGLKTVLYVFTGYVSITGIVSGTTDAATLKATKLTISGMVPVVGNIISDASEAILVSAGLVKNAVGIYGLLVVAAIGARPFLQIALQHLMLKMTAGICETIGVKSICKVVKGFAEAMGMLLAMVGTVSVILMVSTVCFLKGAG